MALWFLFYSQGGERAKYVTWLEWGWWVICKISKEDSHHQKRCDTCKAASSPFEVPVCIVEANKGILPPLYLQENISQTGEITRREGGGWYGRRTNALQSTGVSVCTCMCVRVITTLTALTLQFEEELFRGALGVQVCCCKMWSWWSVVVAVGCQAWRLTRGHHSDRCGLGSSRGGGDRHNQSLVTFSPLCSSKPLSR